MKCSFYKEEFVSSGITPRHKQIKINSVGCGEE